jgi:hypothetical protein
MIVNFINISQKRTHVIIWIFEIHSIANVTMANQVKKLLYSFYLLDKVIAYVKNEGFDLSALTFALMYVIYCSTIQLACPFVGSCFKHAMSMATQYVIDDVKICVEYSKVSLKIVQSSLQKIII